jgi:hypothetical protein
MGKFDVALSETTLAMTVVALDNEIKSYGTGTGKLALLKYLKGQYSARVLLRNGVYNSIPEASKYRMKKSRLSYEWNRINHKVTTLRRTTK